MPKTATPMREQYDLDRGPEWGPGEVARVFFGRDPAWLRHHHSRHHFVLDGEEIEVRRTGGKHRFFYLGDVERVAEALYAGGFIDDEDLRLAHASIRLQAEMWGLDQIPRNGR